MGVARWEPCNICIVGIKTKGLFLGFCTRKTIPTGGPCVPTCTPARTASAGVTGLQQLVWRTALKSMLSRVWQRRDTTTRGRYCRLTFPQCHFQHPPHPPPPSLRHYRQLFPGRFEGIGSARSILEHPLKKKKKHSRRGTRGRLFILHDETNKQKKRES